MRFDKFKDITDSGGGVRLWHTTKRQTWEGVVKSGFDREYLATNSAAYGSGIYTTFTLESSIANSIYQKNIYGDVILESVLIDGFKDFLFFDQEMNDKYNGGTPIIKQLKKYLPKELFEKVMSSPYAGEITTFPTDKTIAGGGHGKIYNSARNLFKLLDIIAPVKTDKGRFYRTDKYLSGTKIRGYVMTGSHDGNVAIIRDFKALVPIKVSFDHGKTWKDVLEKENFESITNMTDAAFRFLGKYPETYHNEKTINGFCRVKKNGKFNYVNVKTGKEVLPIWADEAYPFNPNFGIFVINGKKFKTNGNTINTPDNDVISPNELIDYINGNSKQTNKDDDWTSGIDFDSLFSTVVKEVLEKK